MPLASHRQTPIRRCQPVVCSKGLSIVAAMTVIWTALPTVLLGLLLCFAGQRVARIGLALLGAVIGYLLGQAGYQAVAEAIPGFPVLWQWIFAVAGLLVVGGLAYAFYMVGVLVLMGSLGWQLGWWFGGVVEFDSLWTTIMAVAVAVLAVVAGLVLNVPRLLLVLATALAGAFLIVASTPVLLMPYAQTDWLTWLNSHATLVEVGLVVLGGLVQFGVGGKGNLRASYQ